MADSTNIRSFIQQWEGGLSRNTADTASRNPAPWSYKGVSGYHTNKGITYTTFINLSPLLGYEPSADNFFVMPDVIWDKIFKRGYWDSWYLDNMNSQAIADLIVDFAYMSGPQGSFNSIKNYLITKNVSVKDRQQAVEALNKLSFMNEEKIFNELIDWRKNFFKSLNQPANLNGWLNRLSALKNFGEATILKKK